MLSNLKALVVVFALANITYYFAQPLCLRYITKANFVRRRNTWLILTVTAFVSPSFWLYLFIAVPVILHASLKDDTPASLYVMLMHVVPPAGFFIPIVGINQLFDLTNYRVLAFTILIPLTLSPRTKPVDPNARKLSAATWMVIGYGILRLILEIPYESITNTFRRGFLYYVDVFSLVYYFSQCCTERKQLQDLLASFCLACAVMAPIAFFETIRSWLLYDGVPAQWGAILPFNYLMRDNTLRAQASSGHSLSLGFLMAISLGIFLYLAHGLKSQSQRVIAIGWLIIGLFSAYARAPWITAVFYALLFVALGPKGLSRTLMVMAGGAVAGAIALLSPIGPRILNFLPFVGTVDKENVAYRQQLAEVSWGLITKNPFFGDQFVMQHMESLRQGQGIIDLVNSYAEVALFSGLVGLFLLVCPFLLSLARLYFASRANRFTSPDFSLLGINITAGMIATLLMMATSSFGTALSQIYWIFCGLAMNYVRVNRNSPPEVTFQR